MDEKKSSKSALDTQSLGDIKNDLKWVKAIGWTIVGGFAAAFAGLVTWYLPKEIEGSRQLIRSDIAQQLNSISQDLAVLKSQVSSISNLIPELMKEKLKAKKADLRESLNSIGGIAEKARHERVQTDSGDIGKIGVQVLQIGNSSPT